jgi:hypothetical protein
MLGVDGLNTDKQILIAPTKCEMNIQALEQAIKFVSDNTQIHFLYFAMGLSMSTILWLTLITGIFLGRWHRRKTETNQKRSWEDAIAKIRNGEEASKQ